MTAEAPLRIVADLGNSRLKWARLGANGELAEVVSLDVDGPATWESAWRRWGSPRGASAWAIASVNPPVAARLEEFLECRKLVSCEWFRSAADVKIANHLAAPETAGADRAFAVAAAVALRGGPGIVAQCGTAITVERVSAAGIWEGEPSRRGWN